MPQFDLHKNPRKGAYPLLLDVQSDVLTRLATRIVVPLMPLKSFGGKPISRLNPTVTVAKVEYVLVFQELAAIPTTSVGERVGSLASRRNELIAALDLLFTGL